MRPNGFWTQVDYSFGYGLGQGTSTDQAYATAGHFFGPQLRPLDAQTQGFVPALVIALGALINAW